MYAQPHSQVKSRWTAEEDTKLREAIEHLGTGDWNVIAQKVGSRDPRQCRARWNNYLNPHVQDFIRTHADDELLEERLAEFGPQWTAMTVFFPDHSSDNIKTHRLVRQSENAPSARNINPQLSSASDPVAADQPAQEG
jgi:hypothetical protein